VNSNEFAALCEKGGLFARALESSKEARSALPIPKRTPPEGEEIELFIAADCLDSLLEQRATDSLEKHFQELLRDYARDRGSAG
jgi:hypothetical protein